MADGELLNLGAWALVLTAIGSGVSAIITAWGGFVRSRRETRAELEEECLAKLKLARVEAEHLADQLHALRMERNP